MKTMTIRELSFGRKTKVNAEKTYRAPTGEWIAVVDESEYREACTYVCKGIQDCRWENLQIQADQDDDGKEYTVLTS